MGFFDSVANSSIVQSVQKATVAAQNISDYLQDDSAPSLVSIGVAAAGNLSPAQIAAGLTGAPAQPSVVPSSVPAAAIANANPLSSTAAKVGMSTGMMLVIAAAAYFLVFKKRG